MTIVLLPFCLCACMLRCPVVSDFETLWTVAHQPPLSMEFSRQEYWCGLPFPLPQNHPNPGIEPTFPSSSVGKEFAYNAGDLGQEDPLEKGMATHSSTLAWRIPWTEDLAGYSPWDRRVGTSVRLTFLSFPSFPTSTALAGRFFTTEKPSFLIKKSFILCLA